MLTARDIRECPQEEIAEIHPDDAITLGAQDGIFFNRFFLPETFSLPPAPYHIEVIDLLDNPDAQYKGLQIFRDGAKTTFARARALKKICYGLSHTGLIVSDARPHASKSIDWISKKVKYNKHIKKVFGLYIGDRDSTEQVEVVNPLYQTRTTYIAQGITGQVRGVNIDDARPDFILCDDPCNEENTGTVDQLNKINNLFFGALANSLAARALVPTSEILLLQTILAKGDLIDMALKDSAFKTLNVSIFDKNEQSVWPEKWSTEQLQRQKQGFIDRGQLHIWLREKEGRLTDGTNNAFKQDWVRIFHDYDEIPEESVYFLAVDPVPPPKNEDAVEKHLHRGDWEVWTVLALDAKGGCWIREQRRNRGHQPDWTDATFIELVKKYRPLAVGVETVAFQRVLLYNLRQTMQRHREFVRLHALEGDKRKKFNKIIDTLSGLGYAKKLHVHASCGQLIEQFYEYPYVQKDDDIDSATMAVITAQECYGGMLQEYSASSSFEKDIPDLPEIQLCP